MKDELEVIHGSGNVYADFGLPNPELRQLKAILAAEIIRVLDRRKLTVRGANTETGIAAADFSRIRQAKLGQFTVDRLMTVLDRLGQKVDVSVNVHARRRRTTKRETVSA